VFIIIIAIDLFRIQARKTISGVIDDHKSVEVKIYKVPSDAERQ
jgi:hypothetical protein